jgi:hypothetical protein
MIMLSMAKAMRISTSVNPPPILRRDKAIKHEIFRQPANSVWMGIFMAVTFPD